jgi:hypothetical protein
LWRGSKRRTVIARPRLSLAVAVVLLTGAIAGIAAGVAGAIVALGIAAGGVDEDSRICTRAIFESTFLLGLHRKGYGERSTAADE